MTEPINVWYSDGVRYEDYREDDGRITTVKVKAGCLGCGDAATEDHRCKRVRVVVMPNGNRVEMCQEPDCVLAADHPEGKHRPNRVSLLACPHNIPNFGPPCRICD